MCSDVDMLQSVIRVLWSMTLAHCEASHKCVVKCHVNLWSMIWFEASLKVLRSVTQACWQALSVLWSIVYALSVTKIVSDDTSMLWSNVKSIDDWWLMSTWTQSQFKDMNRCESAPPGYCEHTIYASIASSTQAENFHDVFLCKPINKELIDTFGCIRKWRRALRNVFIRASNTKNISWVI